MRIGLLLCGHVDPKSVHIAGDYPELFVQLLHAVPVELVRYDLDRGQLPESTNECDGWLGSPSRASVYDDDPWIQGAEEFHRQVVADEAPYVGICFGHQLLARALGAEVRAAEHGWNVGVHQYQVDEREWWMGPTPPRELALIASHQDQVVEVPAGGRLLFHAPDGSCPIGGFAFGASAWTIQLHPEFVPDLADHLLAGRIDLIGADKVAAARATLTRRLSRSLVAGWIATFFSGQ